MSGHGKNNRKRSQYKRGKRQSYSGRVRGTGEIDSPAACFSTTPLTLITQIGNNIHRKPEGCEEAGVKLAKKAAELIDLTSTGESIPGWLRRRDALYSVRGAAMRTVWSFLKEWGGESPRKPVCLCSSMKNQPQPLTGKTWRR